MLENENITIQNWDKNAFPGTRAFKLNKAYAGILNYSLFCKSDDVNVISEGEMIIR